jgi:hypothetical protein
MSSGKGRYRSQSPTSRSSAYVPPAPRKSWCSSIFGCSGPVNNSPNSGPNSTLNAFSRAATASSGRCSYEHDPDYSESYYKRTLFELKTGRPGEVVAGRQTWKQFEDEFKQVRQCMLNKISGRDPGLDGTIPPFPEGSLERRLYGFVHDILQWTDYRMRPTEAERERNKRFIEEAQRAAFEEEYIRKHPVNYTKTIYGQSHDMPVYGPNGRTILGYTPNQSRWTGNQREAYQRETERLKSVGEMRNEFEHYKNSSGMLRGRFTGRKTSDPSKWGPVDKRQANGAAGAVAAVVAQQRARYAPTYRGGKSTRKSSRKQRSKKQSKKRKH